MSEPTTPTSAARSSPHPTSTRVPPMRRRSNGSAPRAAAMARWRSGASTGSIGITGLLLGCGRSCLYEVGENAPQLDPRAVGAHVHLGGDVEREPPVDVLLLEQHVFVEDLLLVRGSVGQLVGVVEVVAMQHGVDPAVLVVLRLHEKVEHVGAARLHVVDLQARLERGAVL